MTRSKKASTDTSWIQIPLPVKLTKVLLDDFKSQLEEHGDIEDDGDSDDNNGDLYDEEVHVYTIYIVGNFQLQKF